MKVCDHKSVGVLVWRNDDGALLLIERAKLPYGFAAPAGHVDGDPSFQVAAQRELEEEVGLKALHLMQIWSTSLKNQCRREGGTWHDWEIYEATVQDYEIKISTDEVKSFRWVSVTELGILAKRTESYLRKEISEEEWQKFPGLEPVWWRLLNESGYLSSDPGFVYSLF